MNERLAMRFKKVWVKVVVTSPITTSDKRGALA
jgi:hypothetical protein